MFEGVYILKIKTNVNLNVPLFIFIFIVLLIMFDEYQGRKRMLETIKDFENI